MSLPEELLTDVKRRYDLIRRLGQGGMGEVWQVRLRHLPEKVSALKLTRLAPTTSPATATALQNEATRLLGMRHPHILLFEDFEIFGPLLAMRMSYVEGCSLDTVRQVIAGLPREGGDQVRLRAALAAAVQRLKDVGVAACTEAAAKNLIHYWIEHQFPWSWGEKTARFFYDICQAVSFANEQGFLHCDIKPANILVEATSGKPYVADWGLSRWSMAPARSLDGWRTRAYGAPEQSKSPQGEHGWLRVDQFSLAATIYSCLSGEIPTRTNNGGLSMALGSLDARVAPVLERALQISPADRFASVAEFANSLLSSTKRAAMGQNHRPYLVRDKDRVRRANREIPSEHWSVELERVMDHHVRVVDLSGTDISCADIAQLANYPQLRELILDGCAKIDDRIFAQVPLFPVLNSISMFNCPGISRRGLEQFIRNSVGRVWYLKLGGPKQASDLTAEVLESFGLHTGRYAMLNGPNQDKS